MDDAIRLLKDDHEAVQGLFAEFKKFQDEGTEGVDEMKQALIDDVCSALKVHTQIEEEIFYPAARECLEADDEDLMDEAQADHNAAKRLIAKIEKGNASSEETCELFLELSDAIGHHVEEEETEMFPKVQAGGMDTAEVGARLKARKEELEREASGTNSADSPTQGVMDRISAYLGPSI